MGKKLTLPEPKEISYDHLANLRMSELPKDGLAILNVPAPTSCKYLNVQARNHTDVYIFADVTFVAPLIDREQFLKRIQLSFPSPVSVPKEPSGFATYQTYTFENGDLLQVNIDVNLELSDRPEIFVVDALSPLVVALHRMSDTIPKAFICHASEDKPTARSIALALRDMGATVWIDEWEINVGESIVEKVNAGLEECSHLVLLLSSHSVNKPWVRREFSAALMGQLSERRVTVLPVRLDESKPPKIIEDIKYADARISVYNAIEQLRQVLFPIEAPNQALKPTELA